MLHDKSVFTLITYIVFISYSKILVKYDQLMVNMKDYARRKILAGICMTRTADLADPEVISIATGTKTVGGEYISVSGSALNDSHAEVATRRGLLRYLYSQILLANNKEGLCPKRDPSTICVTTKPKHVLQVSASKL